MLFKAISGYTSLKKNLLNIGKNLQSTFLFTGPSGGVSLALALAYATYLHCTNPSAIDACGKCISCTKMERLTHPDLHFAFPIGTTQQIKGKNVTTTSFLPQWRSFLIKNPYGSLQDWSKQLQDEARSLQIGKPQAQAIKQVAGLKPFESNYKTILIWLPELLHHAASNALLKTLEEPSKQTVFILVVTDPTQLLPTIHSRSLEVYVPPFSDEAMLDALQKHYPHMTSTEHTTLAQVAQGDFNKAQKLAVEHVEDYFEKFVQWLRIIYLQHWTRLVDFVEDFYKRPLQLQKNWIAYGLQIMRGTLLVHFDQKKLAHLTQEEMNFSEKLSKTLMKNQIIGIAQSLEKAHYSLQRNANGKLLLLSISLHMAQLISSKQNKKNA